MKFLNATCENSADILRDFLLNTMYVYILCVYVYVLDLVYKFSFNRVMIESFIYFFFSISFHYSNGHLI